MQFVPKVGLQGHAIDGKLKLQNSDLQGAGWVELLVDNGTVLLKVKSFCRMGLNKKEADENFSVYISTTNKDESIIQF